MIIAAGLLAGAALLLAGALGVTNRDQAAVGITVAAFCGGTAAVLAALRLLLPGASGYTETAILLLLGGVGSGLFTTAVVLSRRLRTASPIAAGGAILLVQALLLTEGGTTPLAGDDGPGGQLNVALLVVVTLAWASAGTFLAIYACRELVRFIGSRHVRRALHAAGILLGLADACGVILVVVVAYAHGTSSSSRAAIVETLTATILIVATVLGLILIATRLRTALRPQLITVRASVLFWQLAWLERRLLAAAPHWARPAGLRTPAARNGASEALYARMVIIWDTTRALLSVTDADIIDASLDFADHTEPSAPPARRAAVAEAGWLHLALCDGAGHGPGEQFTVLAHDAAGLTTDLVGEAGFQLRVARVLRRENDLLERFRHRYVATSGTA